MPKPKQKWVPAERVDPEIFKLPSKKRRAIAIKKPEHPQLDLTYDTLQNAANGTRPSSSVTRAQHQLLPTHSHLPGAVEHAESIAGNAAVDVSSKPPGPVNNGTPSITSTANGSHVPALSTSSRGSLISSTVDDTQPVPNVITNNTTSRAQVLPLRSKLNLLAPNHVPQWQGAINQCHAIVVRAPQISRIDYDAYHSTFAGSSLQRQLPRVELPLPELSKLETQDLTHSTYETYWHERLQNEYTAQAAQNEVLALYGVELTPVTGDQLLYRFKVPGLRESTPRVDLGDILIIRPFLPAPKSAYRFKGSSITTNGLVAGFSGVEHHAVVWSLIRRDELVFVRLGSELPSDLKCNIIIPLQIHKNAPMWRTINEVGGKHYDDLCNPISWYSSMLFPSEGVPQTTLSKGTFHLKWMDNTLNYEQKRSVEAVIDAQYGALPFLISGPPGTGKTKTIVETALQLACTKREIVPHLLVCAPSDAAADTLLVRLSAFLSRDDLFRLNNWTRLASEVPGEVRPYCYLDDKSLFSLESFQKIMSYKVVVTTCRDANVLVTAGLTNRDLASLASRMVQAVAPGAVDERRLIHWTALLIDEAAQATEPEVLIPMSVVAPPEGNPHCEPNAYSPQLVMAGDEHQLGPKLTSVAVSTSECRFDTSGLEVSLFQRLFSGPLYAEHPLSRSHGLRPLTRNMLPITRPPFANLTRNYRSHPAILSMPSALFYADTLIPERPQASSAILSWPRWSRQPHVWPVMFHQNAGPDSVESILEGDGTGSGNILNHSEAQIACNLVLDLMRHVNHTVGNALRGEDVIVLSPFRAQVNYLRQVFRSHGQHAIRIGPLEAFQGDEARVVLICTTRTRLGQHSHPPAKFVNEDKGRNLGVVDEPKRFNVAMTRAKEVLIVIGNAETLTVTRDHCWVNFLRFCTRNELCVGGPVTWFGKSAGRGIDPSHVVGKLEKALKWSENLQDYPMGIDDDVIPNPTIICRKGDSRFKLQGTMVNLDERMWEMQMNDYEYDDNRDIDDEEEQHEADDHIEEEDEASTAGVA